MHRLVHRHLLLPAFETVLKRRNTLRYWKDLEATQWMPSAVLAEQQHRALVQLAAHAYSHCPFYRDAWNAAGLHPRQLTSPGDFRAWPVIDRDTIRAHRAAMRATNQERPLLTKSTGGSSGVPLQFDLDHNSHERRTAAAHRGYGWAGAAPGTKQLYLWGSAIGDQSRRIRWKDALYHMLQRRRVVSCFDADRLAQGLAQGLAERFVSELGAYRPDAIVAYTNPLYEVALRLEESGQSPAYAPRTIVVGAEKLHSFQRIVIERVFRAPVFETYGSREFMLIGAECEHHRGLHITAEQLLVEVLDDEGEHVQDGTEGNVVITDLWNYGMPFVRYATGDRATVGDTPCCCGRGLPLLTSVAGRRLDMLIGSGGRTIPGEFFPHLVKDFPAVRRYQVVQEAPDRVRFMLAADGMTASDRAKLEQLVRAALGTGVHVDFEPVAHIPLTAAGKLQVVINRMPLRRAG